ncbi:MAG: COX15/CtaA family protein [Caldilineaceae bacterium]|nr:COX15/CtaA family protein [Caldilineaceae bacterium]
MQTRRFATYAWGVLAYNVFVIVWGAFVRATGSGAGCGSHWPLCNGEVLLRAPAVETMIEFAHRATSGISLLLVVALVPLAWRAFGRGHRVRVMALVSVAFIVLEALLGAGLVLLEYVAHDVSVARAYWVAGHLINTFLLLAVLTLTAWWGGGAPPLRLRGQPGVLIGSLAAAVVGMLILGASGGITALGDTLLLGAGITPEESSLVATLVDLRIYHPLLAFVVGALILFAVLTARSLRPSPALYRLSWWLGGFYVLQLLVGAFNVMLKAPVAMQLIHLFISDMIWIGVVLVAANALAVAAPVPAVEDSPSTPAPLAGHTI